MHLPGPKILRIPTTHIRGAEGVEGRGVSGWGVPASLGAVFNEGHSVPSPENFGTFTFEMVSCGAFWVAFLSDDACVM